MILFERKIFKSLKHEQIFKKKTFELKFQKKESFIVFFIISFKFLLILNKNPYLKLKKKFY